MGAGGAGAAGSCAAGWTRSRLARFEADEQFRRGLRVADLETALAAAGYEPTDELVDAVRACLPELDQ